MQTSGATAANRDGVRALLAREPRLTAVVFSSDQTALGGLRALREAGREDVSVVGFDDVPAA